MNFTPREIAGWLLASASIFLYIGYSIGNGMNVDLQNYAKLDEATSDYQKKYYEAKKEAYLYKGLDAGCLQELNEYREQYGIKAP